MSLVDDLRKKRQKTDQTQSETQKSGDSVVTALDKLRQSGEKSKEKAQETAARLHSDTATKPTTSGYTSVADLNRATNGAGVSPLEQAARDVAATPWLQSSSAYAKAALDNAVKEKNAAAKNAANQSLASRLLNTAKGSGKLYAGELSNAAAVASDTVGGTAMSQTYRAQVETLDNQIAALENQLRDPTATAQDVREANEALRVAREQRALYADAVRSGENTAGEAYKLADELSAGGAQDIERAKAGASALGKVGIDLLSQGVQMGADALLGAAIGIGGLGVMGARTFGGGAQEARQAGADTRSAALYGIGTAAVEMLTEKLADGVAGIYGKGAADDVVKRAIGRLTQNAAAQNALGVAAAAAGESVEEFISGIVNPALKTLYNGKSVGQNYSELEAGDVLYDMLIGGIMGAVGGTVDTVARPWRQSAETPATVRRVSEAEPVAASTTNDRAEISKPSTPQRISESETRETLPLRGASERQLDRDLADAARLSVTLGRNGANAFLTAYDRATAASVEPAAAFESFSKVYNAAVRGENTPKVSMPEHLRIAAQGAGENDARTAAQARYFGENAGLSPDRSGWPRNLSRREARVLDAMGKVEGVQIRFGETLNGANASLENGVLTIAKDAHDPVRVAASHETVHRVRESAPEAYATLAQFVVDNMSDERFASAIRARADAYSDMNYSISDITEEVVADAFGRMASEPELMEKIAGVDRTAAQKILDAIDELLRKIKAALSGKEQAQLTANQIEAFRDLQGRGEEMAKALRAALQKVQEQAQTANENAATEDGAARYSRSYDPETASVKEQIGNSSDKLNEMEIVASVQVPTKFKSKREAAAWAIDLLQKTGYAVNRQNYGRISFSPKDINYAINYADTPAEQAAIAALPQVLKRGIEIGQHADHKGRQKSTVTFAAPVELNGTRGNMAVVVNRNGDHYYAHRIVMPDGTAFVFSDEKENATREPSRGVTVSSSLAKTTSVASADSVTDAAQKSNTQNGEKRESRKIDSEGRELTEAQAEYFKDSKVRDENGNLIPVYHGTANEFTSFDNNTINKNFGANGGDLGFYFTPFPEDAKGYASEAAGKTGSGKVMEVYLNLTNPLVIEDEGWGSAARQADLKNSDIKRWLKSGNYDGVIIRSTDEEMENGMPDTIYVAFSSNQAKNVDNQNPTSNPDIRFSRKSVADAEEREAALLQENDLLREEIKYWKAQLERTPEENVGIVDPNAVRKTAKKLIADYGSTLAHDKITNELLELYNLMGTGSDERGELSYESAREIANSVARKIAENAVDDAESVYRMYEDLRSFLRTMDLTVTAAETEEISDWGDWREQNSERMQVKRGKTSNIDRIYAELSTVWPEFFPSDVLTVGDQLNRIAEVADYLYRDRGHNPYDPYMDQAVIDIGNDIMERFFDLPQAKTFADKQAAKLESLRVRMSELRARDSERLQRSLAKVRESRDKQIERMTERFRAKTEAGREKQSSAKLRKQIMRHTSALSQKLLRPTDKQHIPDSLRAPVAAMLEAINKESAYDIVTDENGRNKRVPRGEGDVLTKRTQAFAELKKKYAELKDDENLVIDPDLLGDEDAGFQGLFDQVLAMSGTPIQRMSTEQLQTVWKVVRAVEHSVSTYGKTLSAAKYKTTADWASRFRDDTKDRKDRATIGGKDFALGLENPYTFFSQYGESGKAVFRMLRDAQDTRRRRKDRIVDAVHGIADSKTFKELRETRHEFTTERGDTLTLTTAQIMELYNLTKREQAQNHLLKGGIVQPEISAAGMQKRIERGTDMIRLTQEDLGKLAALLTPRQMEIADALQQLTATTLAEWGNEASMAAYGYRKFTEQNYWPIHTAQEALHSKVENDRSNPRSIKNIGMAKALVPNASNAVSVGDVFTTFAEHAADMIEYSSWLLPMEDANRLFNFRYKGDDGYPASTFKQELDRVGGRNGKAQKYWTDLMADIQNGLDRTSRSDLEGLAARAIGNVKGASVGANLRVIVQQPTAYLRANAVMNPESLTKGLFGGVTRGNGWQKAQQYAAIARIKAVGGFDQGSTRSFSNELYGDRTALEKVGDIAGWPAGKADAVTWGALWNAAEWETKRLHPDIAEGSAAFYQKAAEIFTDVIDQTQVVDGVLQRSAIMRSGDRLTQQMTTYMGEPIMALNLMLRSYDNVRYAKTKEQRGAAIRQLGRAVVALAVTDIVNSAVQSLVDAPRKDDKDKDYWERFMTALTGLEGDEKTAAERLKNIYLEGNFADNASLIGKIPLAKDLRSILQGFTVERLDAGAISDLMQSAQQLASGKYAPVYGAYRVAEQAAKIVGIPATNLERDVHAAVRSIFYAIGDPKLLYEYEKAIFNSRSTKNKSRFFATAYMALEQGDTATYEAIRNDLVEKMGVSAFDVDDDMKKRYNKAVKEDGSYTLPQASADLLALRQKYSVKTETEEEKFKADDLGAAAYTRYSNQRARDYKTYKDALEKTTEFRKLSAEDKDRALNWAYSLADEMALEENSEGQYTMTDKWKTCAKDAKRYGISMTNYLTFHMVAETTSSTRDKDGKEVKGQKKADKLRDWLENRRGLTDGQRAWLWGTIYSSEW